MSEILNYLLGGLGIYFLYLLRASNKEKRELEKDKKYAQQQKEKVLKADREIDSLDDDGVRSYLADKWMRNKDSGGTDK